jgi:hypothetical protein
MAAYAVVGWHVGGPVRWVVAVVLVLAAMAAWALVASPRARHGGPVRRPLAKVLVLGLACLLLWLVGHPGWALALLAFSVVVNGLAQLPGVRALVAEQGAAGPAGDHPRPQ